MAQKQSYRGKNRERILSWNREYMRRKRKANNPNPQRYTKLGIIECSGCNQPFKQIVWSSKFCCKQCKSDYEREYSPSAICVKCKQSFTKSRRGSYKPIFCSKECEHQSIRDNDPIFGFRNCKWCEEPFPVSVKRKVYCGRQCAFDCTGHHNSKIRIAALAATPNPLTKREWRDLIAYFGGRCAYCHEPTVKPVKDHVVPVSKGGLFNKENIVPACRPCNASKRDVSLIAFLFPRHFRKKYALRKSLEMSKISSQNN